MSNDLDTMKPVIAGAVGNPASTCAQSCEGNAYRIEIRRLTAERDALVAKLAELEGQEPVAWMEWAEGSGAWFLAYSHNPDATTKPLYARPIPAEPSSITDGFVQPVPDHCDRIVWRGSYYHLPITKSAEPVNARLLEALKACRDQFQHYVGHHLDKGDLDKAAQNEWFVALADAAIASVEAPKNGD